ncbi:phage tail protein [Vagococcus sp. BWB3-3]|uniref:Phage tail protein n=1 Tax=Vagococcus allomyrinae TaxID=2794353 RepID=A0A940P5Y8_9ENTE|nr:major tail protein [Vagococcus allomyrinae]MBP1040366.1 phage tail protein [Vagococcus allomyrinae]
MAKIGVQQLFAWEIDKETADALPTYGEPFRIAKAIEVSMNPQNTDGSLYGDDALDEFESFTTGYDISLHTNDLLPGIEAKLLGRKVDKHGGVTTSTEDEAPLFAIAFRIPLSKGVGGGFQYRILYKTRFTPFGETFTTKGESINFQTPTITGKSMPRDFDGKFNYKLNGDDSKEEVKAITEKWFKEVTEEAGEAA